MFPIMERCYRMRNHHQPGSHPAWHRVLRTIAVAALLGTVLTACVSTPSGAGSSSTGGGAKSTDSAHANKLRSPGQGCQAKTAGWNVGPNNYAVRGNSPMRLARIDAYDPRRADAQQSDCWIRFRFSFTGSPSTGHPDAGYRVYYKRNTSTLRIHINTPTAMRLQQNYGQGSRPVEGVLYCEDTSPIANTFGVMLERRRVFQVRAHAPDTPAGATASNYTWQVDVLVAK